MSELTLMILRIGFLLLLWLFIFAIVYALRSDLFGSPVRRLTDADAKGPGRAAPAAGAPVVAAAPVAASPPPTALPGDSPALGTPPIGTQPGGAQPGSAPLPAAGLASPARSLVITSGVAAGTSIPLDDDIITIGRSGDSSLVIVDEFTSTYHARLMRSGDIWALTDLDSTNGTRLGGERIVGTVRVPVNTPITIGQTTFELRP